MSFTAHHLYFDDVAIGQEWESLGRTVTEADLVNFGRKPPLEAEFARLEGDEEIEKELQTLKTSAAKKIDDSPSA